MQLHQNGLVRLTPSAQKMLTDLRAQALNQVAPPSSQGDLEARILRQAEAEMKEAPPEGVTSTTGGTQPRSESSSRDINTNNHTSSANSQTENVWEKSGFKRKSSSDSIGRGDGNGVHADGARAWGFGANKFKSAQNSMSRSESSEWEPSEDSNRPKFASSVESNSRRHSASEASKSQSR